MKMIYKILIPSVMIILLWIILSPPIGNCVVYIVDRNETGQIKFSTPFTIYLKTEYCNIWIPISKIKFIEYKK